MYPPRVQLPFASSQTVNQVLRRLVVQNDGVAKGIGEWALAAGVGDAGEGDAAVGGARYAREVAEGRASRVVESDANLVGVIRVGRSVCLRLNNVRRGFGAGDQVNIRAAICQGGCQFIEKLREGTVR